MISKFSPASSITNLDQHVFREVALNFFATKSSVGSLKPGTFEMHPNSSNSILISCLIVNPCETTNMWGSFSVDLAALEVF